MKRLKLVMAGYVCSLIFALPALAQKVPDTRLDTDPPGAANSMEPKIAASGSQVYVVWPDMRNGGTMDIYFNRSLDGGATWLVSDIRLDTGSAPGTGLSDHPQIAASEDSVYVVWRDNRNVGWDIYFNRSLDGGDTWLPSDIRLDTMNSPGSKNSYDPQIAVSGSAVYVTWHDNANWYPDIYLNYSLDEGTTWLPSPIRLDTGAAPGHNPSVYPQIAASGNLIYVVWDEKGAGYGYYDIACNLSTDGGATWLPSHILLSTKASGSSYSSPPQVAASGSSVYVTWSDGRNGKSDIYCNLSTNGGATWLATDLRLDTDNPGAAHSAMPTIAAAGTSVYVLWQDERNGPYDIYGNFSTDNGATWLASDFRLTTTGNAVYPEVAASGNAVHVTWQGTMDVYFNRSLDNGTTWLAQEVRLDTGSAPGMAASAFPEIAASEDSVYVVWRDTRNVAWDIYFNIPFGFQPYGTGTSGSGGITPVLFGSGSSTMGSMVSIDVADGLGGADGALLLGFNGPASIPALGGTILVQPPFLLFFLTLGGASGVPGAGAISLPFQVPDDPILLGLRVNFQGMFIDPGAGKGYSMTNGIEMWIG